LVVGKGQLDVFDDYVKMVRERIESLLKMKDRVLIAIDGHCGAGKSTLGREIAELLDANLFHMDDFYLTPELRTPARMQEVGGNVDYMRFKVDIIEGVIKGKPFEFRPFNCKIQDFCQPKHVLPKRVNIIEGSYSLHPTLIEFYDLKIFLEISPEIQERRILKRNGPIMFERFKSLWIPLENLYFEALSIKEKCDLTLKGEKIN